MNKREFLKRMAAAGVVATIPIVASADNSVEHLLVDQIKKYPIGATIQIIKTADNQYIIYGAYSETDCSGGIYIPKKKGA
jgi:hypothetical protein